MGWTTIKDNFQIQIGGVEIYIDLIADRLLVAEKSDEKIAVEIKSFIQPSAIYEFHLAIGQIRNYQLAFIKEEPDRILYLAVPDDTYERFFTLAFVQEAIQYNIDEDQGFEGIFPQETQEEQDRFTQLDYAYIGARYDPDFKMMKADWRFWPRR